MPAMNMAGTVASNPSTGKAVIMSPWSGPKNSVLDARTITGWSGGRPTYANDPNNLSTGAMSTGIGFGLNVIVGPTAPQSIKDAGFSDDKIPGVALPNGNNGTTASLMAIGGGRSNAAANGIAATNPWGTLAILGFGNGGSRDAGAGPVFTGFGMKMVTATGTVANGSAIEAGFTNRSGKSLISGESAIGSNTTASAAPV